MRRGILATTVSIIGSLVIIFGILAIIGISPTEVIDFIKVGLAGLKDVIAGVK